MERKVDSRLDVSHPPTAFRIGMIQAHPVNEPLVTLSQSDYDLISNDLASARVRVQEKLLNDYSRSLYY